MTLPGKWCYAINNSRVTHICDGKIRHHWFSYWLDACSAPSHYNMNQCCLIVICSHRNTRPWNLKQNTTIFHHGNVFENVICKMLVSVSDNQEYFGDVTIGHIGYIIFRGIFLESPCLLQNNRWMDFREIIRRDRIWYREQYRTFWGCCV